MLLMESLINLDQILPNTLDLNILLTLLLLSLQIIAFLIKLTSSLPLKSILIIRTLRRLSLKVSPITIHLWVICPELAHPLLPLQ